MSSTGRAALAVPTGDEPLDVAFMRYVQDVEARQDPSGLFRRLQAEAPVYRSPMGIWFLTKYADIDELWRGPCASAERAGAMAREELEQRGELGASWALVSKMMIATDPPTHTRLRGLVAKAFTPKIIEGQWAPRVAAIADEMVASLAPAGSADLVAQFAFPFPTRVIAEMLGMEIVNAVRLRELSDLAVMSVQLNLSTEQRARCNEAATEMVEMLQAAVEQRRKNLGDDLISVLIRAEQDGDRLTPDELLANIQVLLVAGHETTANLIANGVLLLLRHPEQLDQLRRDPSLMANAVEEIFRFEGTARSSQPRVLTDDVEVRGVPIPKGSLVVAIRGAANRDPEVFPDPDRFDITRHSAVRHLGLGVGIHFCLGASLARHEARSALDSVFRLPGLELATDSLRWIAPLQLRGLESLPVRWRVE